MKSNKKHSLFKDLKFSQDHTNAKKLEEGHFMTSNAREWGWVLRFFPVQFRCEHTTENEQGHASKARIKDQTFSSNFVLEEAAKITLFMMQSVTLKCFTKFKHFHQTFCAMNNV